MEDLKLAKTGDDHFPFIMKIAQRFFMGKYGCVEHSVFIRPNPSSEKRGYSVEFRTPTQTLVNNLIRAKFRDTLTQYN
jgi:hypothetical protein